MVSRELARVKHEDLSRARSHSESFTEVDMEDDEIIDIWKTTPTENDSIPSILSSTCHMCVDVVNHTAAITAQEEDEEQQDNTGSLSLMLNMKSSRRSGNNSRES